MTSTVVPGMPHRPPHRKVAMSTFLNPPTKRVKSCCSPLRYKVSAQRNTSIGHERHFVLDVDVILLNNLDKHPGAANTTK